MSPESYTAAAERLALNLLQALPLRKDGSTHFDHARAVADRVPEGDKAVAFLHDVLEDTGINPLVLRKLFGDNIADDVEMLTKPEGMGYMSYIRRIIVHGSPRAIRVKLADNEHNLEGPAGEPWFDSLAGRYVRSREMLLSEVVRRQRNGEWDEGGQENPV